MHKFKTYHLKQTQKADELSADFRFPKVQRLVKPAEYKKVYSSKHWGRNSHFAFNVSFDTAVQEGFVKQNRIGITVSKKVSKLAVVRNKIKRQVKEFYRHNKEQVTDSLTGVTDSLTGVSSGSINIVITARARAGKASNKEIQGSLQDLWKKILKTTEKLHDS